MARILFSGAAPWCHSGYSKPLRFLFPRLHALGVELGLCAFYGYQGPVQTMDVNGAPVKMFGINKGRWFNDTIHYHAAAFDADAVITLQDVWTLDGWASRGFNWMPWMPVDTDPVDSKTMKALDGCDAPMSYSQWGQYKLIDAGWPSARYLPFGVDLELHRPIDKALAREAMGLPVDGFIAGMVAANSSYPSRKSFPEVAQAWKKWTAGGGKGLLYLHTMIPPRRDHGINFVEMMNDLELPWSPMDNPNRDEFDESTVLFSGQHRLFCGSFSDADLVNLYNAFDVLLMPSMSEGFGMPLLEAQACGVPVVTLNFSSMPELTFSGQCLEPIQLAWEERGGWRGIAGVDDITEAIEWAYQMSRGSQARQYLADKATVGARPFGWDRVVDEHWKPVLEMIDA